MKRIRSKIIYIVVLIAANMPWLIYGGQYYTVYQLLSLIIGKNPKEKTKILWNMLFVDETKDLLFLLISVYLMFYLVYLVLCVIYLMKIFMGIESNLNIVILWVGVCVLVLNFMPIGLTCDNIFVGLLYPFIFLVAPFLDFLLDKYKERR